MSISKTDYDNAVTWDDLRRRFGDSALKNMELAKLGQNAGISWPFKGHDETPEKYIGFDFEELQSVPGLIGKKSRIKKLMNIMIETLAFDDPFGDMADRVEAGEIKDEAVARNLRKFQIPGDFPIALIRFRPETIEAFKQAGAGTLGEAIEVNENGDPLNPLSDEIEILIRAISNKDEEIIAKFLPYRKGGQGVHLAEAISAIAENLEDPLKFTLMEDCGFELEESEHLEKERMTPEEKAESLQRALGELEALNAWFTEESRILKQVFSDGSRPERFFLALNDPAREQLAIELSEHQWGGKGQKKSGFFGRLFGKS